MPSKRSVTYSFVDASNIIYGARAEGWMIDQKKLIDYLKTKFKSEKTYFYFGKIKGNYKQVNFLEKLKNFGFTLRVKDVKQIGKKFKANCDVDLTMDMLLDRDKYNKAIVLSGDGDFLPLYEYLKIKEKKRIVIMAFSKITAKDIKKFAKKEFIAFENQKYLLERKKR